MAHVGSLHDTRVILQFKSDCERLTTKESMKGAGDTNIPDTLLSSIYVLQFDFCLYKFLLMGFSPGNMKRHPKKS